MSAAAGSAASKASGNQSHLAKMAQGRIRKRADAAFCMLGILVVSLFKGRLFHGLSVDLNWF